LATFDSGTSKYHAGIDSINLNILGSNVFFLKVTAEGGFFDYFGPYNLVIGCNTFSTDITLPTSGDFNLYNSDYEPLTPPYEI
jgi:hypothetical protein